MNKIVVQGDQMYFYSKPNPIPSGQVEFSVVEFQFSPEWLGFDNKIAQFRQGSNIYNVAIQEDKCNPPSELLPGYCQLRIKGYSEDAVIATANELLIPVAQGFESGGITPVPPTPDLYQQLIEQFGQMTPPRGGTAGQFLAKASDEDYDYRWKTGSGGGGASSWEDISDKPFERIGTTMRVTDGALDVYISETSNPQGGNTLSIG